MVKGVFTELDPEQTKRRLSWPKSRGSISTASRPTLSEILDLMARTEKMRARIDEPLEVRGEIPVTLPPNTTGKRGVHHVLLCVQYEWVGRGRQRRSS